MVTRKKRIVSAFILVFILAVSFVSSAHAEDINLTSAIVIDRNNVSTYNNKSVAGIIPSDSSAGENGNFTSKGAIVVDGIELNLTIDGLNVDYSEKYSMLSGISLVNGAKLHLTVNGTNNLKAGYGGAGIAVPDGTTLEITAESTGTLNATGGKNYGGGAGIGSIGNGHNTATTGNGSTDYLNIIQGLGDIIINGGTINARGGTWYNYYTPVGGAAGIGSSEFSGMIDPNAGAGNSYTDTTYINNLTGSITINDGTINAKGGNGAAGIGGGNNGTLRSITINGGTVTAAGSLGAAIGTGWNGNTDGSSLLFPNISITGGLITANGSIGSGGTFNANQYASGKITLSPSALYSLSNTVIYAEKYCAQTVEITGGNTWGINEFVIVHNGEAVGYCGTGAVPDVSKIDGKTLISNAYISSLGNVNISQTQNGSVTADLTQNVPAGHTVTLTITPETNYILHTLTVKDFYGNTIPVKKENNSTFTFIMQMNGSVTVSATFDSRNSVINITPSEHGTVYTENVSALAGETVWLTVTSEDGYRLSSLTVKDAGGNDVAVTNNSFVMPNGNVTITAEFAAIYYTITTGITGEGGTVATDHSTARKGDTVTLTLNTNDGCSFVGLTVKDENGNEITVTDNAFTMPSGNVTVEAAFQKIPYYDVTIQPDAYNRGAVYADRSFAYAGDTVTLTVRPYNDKYFMYELDTLSVKDSAGNEIPVTDSAFTMPSSNVTVNATFRTVGSNNPRYRIDVQTTGKGSVYVDMRIIGDNIERYVNSAYAHKKIILDVYPNRGFSLSSLTVKDKLGYTIPVADDNTFYMPASDVTVEAVFKEDGDYSIAVQTIGNGWVSLNKSRANEGDSVRVSAVPSHGNKLDSLTVRDSEGNDVSVENGTFTMPASDVTVEAIFKEDGYSIAVQKVGSGQVILNRSRANEGDTVEVNAVPLQGSTLDSLMVRDSAGNTITMTGNTFTMPAGNVTVEAVFKKDGYSIVVRKFGNGQVSLNRSRANEGDTVGVNAVPSSGNVLDSLRVKDSNWNTITMTNNTFTMPASDVTVEAVFKKEDSGGGSEPPVVEYNITVQIIGSGQVSVSSNTAKAGDTITMDIAPSSWNTLGSLTVKDANGNDVSITNNTFTMPASNVTVKAVFEEVRYSITVNAEHGKVIAPSSARPGTSVTLTPVPDGGYRFVSMTVDGENFTGGAFVMPEHNVTVSAVFSSYYIGANGKEQELPEGTQTMTSSTTEWSGWYLVQDSVTISGRVSVNGEAHVILADGACLTVTEGINVANKDSSSDSLTIYGQTDGTGELIASGGTDQAGIGGNSGENCGIVTINGGRVTAIGGFLKEVDNVNHGTKIVASGAGIGGGSGGNGGTVTINGGRVTAAYCTRNGGLSITGLLEKDKGAGIGGGVNGSGGTLVIGWTNQNDSLVASGYTGTVRIKDGQFMTDGKENYYAGEVSDVSAIANKTLVPAVEVRSITVVTNGVSVSKTLAKQGEEVILVPSIGYEIVSASYNNGFIIQPDRMGTCKFIMPDNDVEVSAVVKISSEFGATDDYTPDGTESKPYVISTANGWNMFCDLLNVENFAGNFLKLSGDLMVTRMAGSDTHSFKGTFDGSGHTLTVSYDIAEDKAAPFRYVDDGCVIKNLHVAGNITIVSDDTLHKYAAGLIGQLNANSNVSIDNCQVSVTITDTQTKKAARYHGGFVASQARKSKLNMTGCVFDGKLLGEQETVCGGFVGYAYNLSGAATTNITNSLFAPSEITMITNGTSATFIGNIGGIKKFTNSYYTQPFNSTNQGTQGYAVTAGEGITIALASENVGVSFDGRVYAGSGETVSLTIASSNGQYAIKSCTASAGTLTESDGTYSLTMPAENVTITAELELVGYAVRFDEGIAEGLMTADKETATYGETVTLTVKAGYEAENVTVMDGETSIAVTKNADGTYSFTMPLGDVRVTATVRATEYEITYNLDGGEVSTANPAKYTITTATFTLNNPTKDGYTFTGWTGTGLDAATKTVTIPIGSTGNRTYTAGFEKNLSYWGKTDSNTPDGTGENPYIISTVDGWNLLVKELNSGNSYSGKVFSLNDDLTVTTMLGTNGTGFAGTFEGNGKTLTFNYDGADDYVAPFRNVNVGTIKDLTVTGTIKTSGQHVGGIVGQSSGETTIEACNFVGKLLTTNVGVTIGGGFVAENNGTLTISNSLYAPATLSDGETEPSATGTTTFSRNTESHTSEIMNSYYTRKLGTEQGKQGYTVTAETGITVALAEGSTNGLSFDGTIYAGSNETVSLTISGGNTKDGYTFKGYSAGVATLTESDGKYSLTMPATNVTISANFAENVSYKDANGNDATTSDYTVMTSDMTNLTAGTYVVKESVTVSALTLGGDVNLILCDGATLTVTEGVSGANSLVIYGQTNGTGTLTATTITLTGNKDLSVYGGTLTAETITVAGTVTVKNATVNGEKYDGSGDSTTSYTVTFDSNGGSAVTSQTLKFKYGEAVRATEPAEPTRENYGFVTWLLNDKTYDFATVVSRDITLTADWAAIVYDIEYLGVDGATNNNPTSYTVEDEITLTEPTKNGSTFAGWTGTGLSEATKSVTITKGSTGKRTYTATWTGGGSNPDPDAPTFTKHSLVLNGMLGMNFFMNLPSGVDYNDGKKYYMEFNISGDTKSNNPQQYDATFKNVTGEYYGFRCYVKSIQMANKITATFHYDGKSVSHDYTVKEYLDGFYAEEGDTTALGRLAAAIKDYGHYVQPVLSETNGWKLGTDYAVMDCVHTYTDADIQEARTGVSDKAIVRDTGSSGIEKVTFTLELDSDTTLDIFLVVPDDCRQSLSVTYNGGGGIGSFQPDGRYKVQISDIAAHQLGDTYTIGVSTSKGSFNIEVSALSYVHTVLNGTNETDEMKKAVTALYKYYKATLAYRDENN